MIAALEKSNFKTNRINRSIIGEIIQVIGEIKK
jgi:hypothetical protein